MGVRRVEPLCRGETCRDEISSDSPGKPIKSLFRRFAQSKNVGSEIDSSISNRPLGDINRSDMVNFRSIISLFRRIGSPKSVHWKYKRKE